MPDPFVTIPISTDPDVLFQEVVDRIQQQWPDWKPEPGNLDTVLVLGWAFMLSELAIIAAQVPEAVLQQLGKTLFSLPPQPAVSAQGTSTWKAIDAKGYTIKAGDKIVVPASGDNLVAFEVMNEVVIAPGDEETAAGEVLLQAVESGAPGNDLSGTGDPVDALDWIDTITLVGETSGGVDAETSGEYSERLKQELQLLTPRPIIPPDFEIRALQNPHVVRAMALDGYDPEAKTFENERMVAVAVIDEDGNGLSAEVKEEVDDDLQSKREVNFVVNVIDPDYTKVDVSLEAFPLPGYSKAQVELAIEEALDDYLDPSNSGKPLFGETGSPGGWRKVTTLRLNDIIALVEGVPGVDYTAKVEIAKHGAGLEAKDLELDGAAPLTQAGDMTVTVA